MNLNLLLRVAADNWSDPSWWRGTAFPKAKYTILKNAMSLFYRFSNQNGTNFMEEDWDNLIILDACRYDMFEETNSIEGSLEKRRSLASSTPEFVTKTFSKKTYHDTVYVTANPQLTLRADEDVFYKVDRVWESHWDDELSTVRPEKMVERTIDAYERYPNKRIISHFMQPHYPFIGETAQEELGAHSGFELSKRLATGEKATRDADSVWNALERGEVSKELVWKAYVENLELVLEEVERLTECFVDKTVITSDHGNLLGESVTPFGIEVYGHPTGIHAENLVTVPWLVQEGESRKEITTGAPEERTEYDSEMLEDRLADLGYA